MNQSIIAAIDAYGGKETWTQARSIEAEFSARGLAFILKRRPKLRRAKIAMDISRPFSRITPIGRNREISGVLNNQDVHLEAADGEVIRERKNARQYFPGGRRLLYWDDLDMAYFANYAMWNYLTLPALLMRTDIIWKEIQAGFLEALFPIEIPTHSQRQHFRFDLDTGLLLQHDYTAEVIGRLAKAAHLVCDHSDKEGLRYSSYRRVTPRSAKGKPLGGPTLIEIKIHDYQLNF